MSQVGSSDDASAAPDALQIDAELPMAEFTAQRTVTIVNPQGLHARPADLFVRLANQYESVIGVRKGNETVDGKSILSILTLAATEGTELEIQATGP
jgi:phosphocarrier protein HPr